MTNLKQSEKYVSEGVLATLSKYEFKRANNYTLVKTRPKDITWQLRFGARRDATSKRILVSISAGIRFECLEEIRDGSVEDDPHPSFAVPIHFLHDDHSLLEWDAQAPETIVSLVNEVNDYALPFFEKYEKLENLLTTLQSENPKDCLCVSRNQLPELLAALMMTLGMVDDARLVLEQAIAERPSKPPGHRLGLERMLKKLACGEV